MINDKYREYFDIDEDYFPQINDSSIAAAAPDFWKHTYPHSTFVEMLTDMERVLARQEKRSLWIEGAYGTGKSQCAYALKKILDVPDEELRDYWNRYESLKKKPDLLEKLIGHKQKGIVTAYRYASGMINSPRDLFLSIQETLKAALIDANLYAGENTLKESAIAWIDEPEHKQFFDALLRKPEWSSLFSQSTADEVISALRKSGDAKSLMDNIFRLADKEGITALSIDADRLIAWITDVIDHNDIRIVFIWDEFSDYFKNNRESLSEFQKIAELVNLKPFYLTVVTHESGQLFSASDNTWTKVRDRFIPIEISLPDNIAFELIGHAFKVKPSAKESWETLVDGDLGSRTTTSRSKVMAVAKIDNPQVMKDIMPLHPMAALILKNIASAFKSNQRSMFDFIKSTNTDDVKAFQWFIENAGPFSNYPLLTVDMLWNFFYEKGRDNLTSDIRLILDTFPQQQNLRDDEKAVLKSILIMQAIDQRLGGQIELFKATEQNLSYVFEGISDLEGTKSASIAKGLKDKGILVYNPTSGGRYVYAAAVLAGDQAKIDTLKNDIRKNSTTAKLVTEGELSTVLSLGPPLRLRFETEAGSGKITPVTMADFTRTINTLRDKPSTWNFHAVIAFAKDDAEAASFRRIIKDAVSDKQYEAITFIDALSNPLGQDAFEQYVDYAAMAMYYSGNQNDSSRENTAKAKRVLDQDWKNRIYNGQFIVYTYSIQEGEKLGNAQGVASFLQTVVTNKYPFAFDFAGNLSESQLKATPAMKQSAKCGIEEVTSGVVGGIEKRIIPTVWKVEEYWKKPATASLSISKIKTKVDELFVAAFAQDGQISIGEVYDLLQDTYGFAPCNLSAFLTGFLLKEYGVESFRYSDTAGGHEPMTPDKLAEMIGNYIGKTPKPTYIVKMTADEMTFYELTEKAWGIDTNSCSSVSQAVLAISEKMRKLGLPIWCLEEVDTTGAYDVLQMYIDLVQSEGKEAHKKAIEIGRLSSSKGNLADSLFALLTNENCQNGMREYLRVFENGKASELAMSIGAESAIIPDLKRAFDVKHSCLWDKQLGEDEIRKLIVEYSVVNKSNEILNASAHSLVESKNEWRERLKFLGVSYEALRAKYPALVKFLDVLIKLYRQEDILHDQLRILLDELTTHGVEIRELLNNDRQVFSEIYRDYLEELTADDIAAVKTTVGVGLFALSKTDCNIKVKEAAEEYRKNQIKLQLFGMWKEKTKTKNPIEWSALYRTPILSCVDEGEFESAKKAFSTLNQTWGTDSDIKFAISFLETTSLFDVLNDESKRDEAFIRDVVGEYAPLLTNIDVVRDQLERLSVDTYNWRDNPNVKSRIQQLAQAEYNSGGSDKALMKIDTMDGGQLKQYLKRLVRENVTVGIEILADGGRE